MQPVAVEAPEEEEEVAYDEEPDEADDTLNATADLEQNKISIQEQVLAITLSISLASPGSEHPSLNVAGRRSVIMLKSWRSSMCAAGSSGCRWCC